MEALVARLGIEDWDLLLVGDGSGADWFKPVGYACVVHDRETGRRHRLYGGLSCGLSSLAELLPYVHALACHSAGKAKGKVYRAHIVSDNQALVTTGTALAGGTRAAADVQVNQPFWAALMAYARLGYTLRFHWIARDTLALNRDADTLGRSCFRAMKTIPLPADDVYDINPAAIRPAQSQTEAAQ
jgi:hypothetical protein